MAVRAERPKVARGGARAVDARAANDRIAERAERLRFVSRVPMLCECSAPDCRQLIMISLEAYRRIRRSSANVLTAPGHDADRTELQEATPEYEVRRRSRCENDGERRSA